METYLKEKIGNPDLFTGRRKELAFFSKWIDNIKKEISKSTAILSRRKTGKTALMQRLYNLTFEKNAGVIPFYYEVREGKQWSVEFCKDFFLTFLSQYIAFKTRNPAYITPSGKEKGTFSGVKDIVRKEGLDYLLDDIEGVEELVKERSIDHLWLIVKEMPLSIATRQNEYIVQMIDEFQNLNSEIYRDEGTTNLADDFAAGYMSTAEYRNAPLLIAGSWVGWLRHLLHTMLPSRFRQYELEDMPEDETVEMIYKYAQIYDTPITEEVVYAMAKLCEGNPFYISAVFESAYTEHDLTTSDGLLNILEYETLDSHGHIRGVWMEYLGKVFYQVNQENAKNLVLYLCQHRDREVGRDELMKNLTFPMTERELEEKLHALVKSDIIEEGRSNFYYRSVQDNIFDKVFRGQYADDIRRFDSREIHQEYRGLYEQAQREYRSLLGKYNQMKGLFAEFAIINQLRLHARHKQQFFCSITHNLPEDFRFVEYDHVWSYKFTRPDRSDLWVDILARAGVHEYSLIGEVKNRSTKAFSRTEAEEFVQKAQELQEREQIARPVLFVFSLKGFTREVLEYFQEQGIAYSEDDRWLGE